LNYLSSFSVFLFWLNDLHFDVMKLDYTFCFRCYDVYD